MPRRLARPIVDATLRTHAHTVHQPSHPSTRDHPEKLSYPQVFANASEPKAERQSSINDEGVLDDSAAGRTKTKLTRVSQLGATGRSVVFKARSRAERDRWVLAIQVEIERLAAQNEEVRLVDGKGK